MRRSWSIRRAGAVLFVASLMTIAGCSSTRTCDVNPAYVKSAPTDPLKFPDGLEPIDDSSALRIPPGPREGIVKDADGRCLEAPPQYFAMPGEANHDGLPVAQAELAPRVAPVATASQPGAASGQIVIPGASVLTNDVATMLVRWTEVWSQRDAEGYFTFYVADFAPAGYENHQDWQDTQRERFAIPATTQIELDSLQVEARSDGSATAEFVQRFGAAPNFRSVLKEMELVEGGSLGWLIQGERILDVL